MLWGEIIAVCFENIT